MMQKIQGFEVLLGDATPPPGGFKGLEHSAPGRRRSLRASQHDVSAKILEAPRGSSPAPKLRPGVLHATPQSVRRERIWSVRGTGVSPNLARRAQTRALRLGAFAISLRGRAPPPASTG
eukprot:scaffold81935_cov34-Tisochrysis_lutea.AAC.3